MLIEGPYTEGTGGAAKVTDTIHDPRCEATGLPLVKGSFNVGVPDAERAAASFGEPVLLTDLGNKKLGPLRWWQVRLRSDRWPDASFDAFIVRHVGSNVRDYLEVMATTRFRDLGAEPGDALELRRHDWWEGPR